MLIKLISQLKIILWLNLHGCDTSEVKFYFPEIYCEFYLRIYPFELYKKAEYVTSGFFNIPTELERAYYGRDWRSAKKYKAVSKDWLDQMPF